MLAPPLLLLSLPSFLPSLLLTAKCARFCWIQEDVRSLTLSRDSAGLIADNDVAISY